MASSFDTLAEGLRTAQKPTTTSTFDALAAGLRRAPQTATSFDEIAAIAILPS